MTQGFTGFSTAHFDAYLENKWRSNRFNLERMRVREQVEALGNDVLNALGDDGARLHLSSTTDHPTIFNNKLVNCQWVMLGRAADVANELDSLVERERLAHNAPEDNTPPHTQVLIGLVLDVDGVRVEFRCHAHAHLDRSNFLKRVSDAKQSDALLAILQGLPEQLLLSVSGDESVEIKDLSSGQLETLLAAYGAGNTCWSVRQQFERDDALVASPEFKSTVATLVEALLPLYDYFAWSEDNDYLDGVTYLAESAAETSERPEPEEPESKQETVQVSQQVAQQSDTPTTKGGAWNYRPGWEFKGKESKTAKQPSTPSARVRQRAQDVASGDRDWSYGGGARNQTSAGEETQPRRSESRHSKDTGSRRDGGRKGRRPDRGPGSRDQSKRPARGGGERRGKGPSGKERFDRRQQKRERGPRNFGPSKSRKPTSWVAAEGEIDVLDHVKVTGGLLNGKVGKVVDITKKGHLKVDIGDMVFEVPADTAEKVQAE